MPRRTRRSGAAGARRPGGMPATVAATFARRREARAPRVVVRDGAGQPRELVPGEDPVAQALVEAAEELISAAQRGSGA